MSRVKTHITYTTVVLRERGTGEFVNSGQHEWTELEYLGPYRGSLEKGEQKVNVFVTKPEYNKPDEKCRSVCSFTVDGTPDYIFDYNGRLVKMWTTY